MFQYYTFTLRRPDLQGYCTRKIIFHHLLSLSPLSPPSGYTFMASPPPPPPPSAITTHWSRIVAHSKHPPAYRLWCFARFIRKTQFSCFPGNDNGWLELPGTKEIQMWLPEDSGPALACPHTGTSSLLSCHLTPDDWESTRIKLSIFFFLSFFRKNIYWLGRVLVAAYGI